MATETGRGTSFRWRAGGADASVRVSDADRNEVADRLAKHYSEGRLDQGEFSERLDRVMSAKTRADLGTVLADLPGTPASGPRPRHGHMGRFLLLVLAVIAAAAVGQAIVHSYVVLILLTAAILAWLRYGPRHRR
jgi:hypothetical protein